MINQGLYSVLTSFGGGKWMSLAESVRVLSIRNNKFNLREYKHFIRKCLAYGWIKCQKAGLPIFAYKNMFGITQRGSDALEFYKDMRYHHTNKKCLLSPEGKAMITLPK